MFFLAALWELQDSQDNFSHAVAEPKHIETGSEGKRIGIASMRRYTQAGKTSCMLKNLLAVRFCKLCEGQRNLSIHSPAGGSAEAVANAVLLETAIIHRGV